ncbi:MAG: RNA polymerase sigma factor [Gemmatimonas sp.]|jgi:RNA polymerase sigma-70 factor (ECF subfamily)|uniref:RNA polymerase sigma factor n=1 Tax=Gemmatimonas sp. TaxID=1962908 RepID=UPI00391F1C9E|nr:RNA polymerase sigma factor [Gemmatimonadota bacterium]
MSTLTVTPSPPAVHDDDALLARIRAGDHGALGALYERWAPRLLRVAWRIVGARAEAEDVVHDVFVALPRAAIQYRSTGRAGAWLVQCATRAALMSLRSVRRRREAPMPPTELVAASHADQRIDLLDLERRLAALPVGLRTVVVLHRIEGFSHAEIADTLGISEGNSRVRLTRALTLLTTPSTPATDDL